MKTDPFPATIPCKFMSDSEYSVIKSEVIKKFDCTILHTPVSDYREEETKRAGTPVKKLKKKKNIFRKNNIAPSDDEYELSDVQTSPKRELPWVRSSPSPRKMLDDVDNHSKYFLKKPAYKIMLVIANAIFIDESFRDYS